MLALILMAGFYLLALVVVAGLGLILYLEVTSRTINAFLTIVAILGIFTIVSGIVPRRRKFIEPGPRVTPEDQPELFAVVHQVAEATGGPRPHDVYVVADVNAGVAHVRGLAGIGSRPVMVLGLPLIATLTVSELRGVIAHEFGHFVGGETKLAPVIYRTREAIGRTVMGLAASGHWFTRLLRFPFHLYGVMYLSITQAISRRQELDADAMAARIAGGTSMESALVKTHHAGLALVPYLTGELGAVLSRGYRPPFAEGFARFLKGDEISVLVQRQSLIELDDDTASPFDSHPSLPQRLEALKAVSHEPAPLDDPGAIGLLRDPDGLEVELLRQVSRLDVDALQPISWEDTTGKVWLGVWHDMCREHRALLQGNTPASLPQAVHRATSSGSSTTGPHPQEADSLLTVLGAALALVLARRGWSHRCHSRQSRDRDARRGRHPALRRGASDVGSRVDVGGMATDV